MTPGYSPLLPPANMVSRLLPPEGRDILIRAARVNLHIPPGMDKTRSALVNDAIRRVKNLYPDFFKKEQ